MTKEKALIGNIYAGVFLIDDRELNVTGFSLHFLPFMFSCRSSNFIYAVNHDISFAILGISFSFSITHPWIPKNN
jgi:dolichyl-phosphate-mannose--protein O-mannosyl transferase|tara:strand:- start:6 stop:230 length:225 start_codon:yes stop_codon:yes gene_type:complete